MLGLSPCSAFWEKGRFSSPGLSLMKPSKRKLKIICSKFLLNSYLTDNFSFLAGQLLVQNMHLCIVTSPGPLMRKALR